MSIKGINLGDDSVMSLLEAKSGILRRRKCLRPSGPLPKLLRAITCYGERAPREILEKIVSDVEEVSSPLSASIFRITELLAQFVRVCANLCVFYAPIIVALKTPFEKHGISGRLSSCAE